MAGDRVLACRAAGSAGGVQAGRARASPFQADVPGPVTPESSPAPTQMRPLARRSLALPLLAFAVAACGQRDELASPAANAAVDRAASAPTSKASVGRARGVGGGTDGSARRDAGAPEGFAVLTQTAPVADEAQEAAPSAPPPPPTAPAVAGAPPQGAAAAAEPAAIPSLVIRTGTAAVQVDSLDRAVAAMRATVERLGGWVANSSVQAGREQIRSATLELKIPAARFDALTGSIGTVGKLEQLDVSAEDVSEEFVDVSARVANARRLEARLISLLERSAGRLSDVLAVERELARVREEIERYDGRLRYLRTRAAVSTLTVTLHEPLPIVAGQPGRDPIAAAFRAAWRNFVSVVAGLIASLGVLVPLAAVAAAVWFGVVPAVRRRRPPGDAPPPPPVAEAPRRDRAA